MTSPEERQVDTCLLKLNLQDLEELFKGKLSALPALDEENDQQIRATLAALREARSVNAAINELKLENGWLTAKRMRLHRECNEITKKMEKINEENSQLTELINQGEQNSRFGM